MPDTRAARTNTKDDLRSHARQLFARHGYEGVSMRDIAGAVGIRQSAIYNHFPSKQHLLADLMVRHMDRLLDAMRGAITPHQTPADALEAFARFHVTYHIDQPEDVFLAYMELRSLDDAGRKTILALRDAYEHSLRDILKTGLATGAFAIGDPAVTARALLAMMTGVTVWFKDGGALDRQAVADIYVRTTMQAVGYKP
jgi:AcrR family transcriptional regulator